ncbi:MAG TPA: radical SAM protein [Armatimonadota bacterium]|nr:radical SAM protein [Armatimonadota bacterium]
MLAGGTGTPDEGRRGIGMIVREITCKSILSDTGLPADYAINCYVGCEHACRYCYARYMKRFTGHREPWGTFVDVRTNAPEVLERQIRRKPQGSVMLSSVCDGWQPLERKYGVSGRCVEMLAGAGWHVSILTKGAIVRRVLPALEGKSADIGVTVTAFDEKLRQAIEPAASPTAERFDVLREAAERGLAVWAFLGPLLPLLTDTEENLEALFAAAARLPLTHIHTDRVNFRSGVAWSLKQMVAEHFPELADDYLWLGSDGDEDRAYADQLETRIADIAERHGLSQKLT